MPRKALPTIAYPLPNNDPRKRIEIFISYFIDNSSQVEPLEDLEITISQENQHKFRMAFYRYRNNWYQAADLNPILQYIANVMRNLKLCAVPHDPNKLVFKYTPEIGWEV